VKETTWVGIFIIYAESGSQTKMEKVRGQKYIRMGGQKWIRSFTTLQSSHVSRKVSWEPEKFIFSRVSEFQ